jgi:hypothetical protein
MRAGSMTALAISTALLAFAAAGGPRAVGQGQDAPAQFRPAPHEVARVEGYPVIGKWMIAPDLSYADWLGARYEKKRLREPINVIIVDGQAASPDEASRRFLEACAKAGYLSRPGHSGGYFGWLGGRLFPQIPPGKHHALSDEPFELHNNHGRFFGPCLWNGRFYWVGALSREKMNPATRAEHEFVSFNVARDRFARALVEKGGFRVTAFQKLDNAIWNDPKVGTGDHDGVAIVLTAAR